LARFFNSFCHPLPPCSVIKKNRLRLIGF